MSGGPISTFTYDDASQLLNLTSTLLGTPLDAFAYTYDPLGNRSRLTDRFGLHSYAYDALNRLTSAAHPLASGLIPETFTYDPVGNRTSSHLSLAHTYDAANRLLEDATFLYTYDANGNLNAQTRKRDNAQTRFTYDVENQLTRIDLPNGTVASYRYDGLGRRIEKNINSQVTRYLYDQEDIVALFSGPANCQTHAFLHGPGIDQPLAFVKDTNGDCNPFVEPVGFREPIVYLQTDGLGSPTSLISETGGFFRSLFLAERYTYDSFGQPTITAPDGTPRTTSAFGNPYLFTGREYDSESGLYYYRARYYDPRMGRFLQEDPIFSSNLYPYVENNPVNLVDPSGLFTAELVKRLVTRAAVRLARREANVGFRKSVESMSQTSLRRTVRSLEKRIVEHEGKLKDAAQALASKHHRHEIRVFKEQLAIAKREAVRRGERAAVVTGGVVSGAGEAQRTRQQNGNSCPLPEPTDGTSSESDPGSIADQIVDFLVDPETAE